MEKPLFTPEELEALGFKEVPGDTIDDIGYYRWWKLQKNASELEFTYEYETDGTFITGYADMNGETLKGRPLTKQDIQLLIEIM